MEVYPGADEKVRVAKLKTKRGALVRPLQRLYPLEVDQNEKPSVVGLEIDLDTENVVNEEANSKAYVSKSGKQVKPVNRYGQWNS